ncbi:hypothetical protein Ddye_013548 [Dipteronia dyeriana]|uniref:Uncharacterized protein n=1 Tax=Dipteronia dyeriana TaxID=168575 RepID=A0AAD9X6M2_9ROSI|nr:hypothetical protein Ddye_013548 [Dipteronia dyeriana]
MPCRDPYSLNVLCPTRIVLAPLTSRDFATMFHSRMPSHITPKEPPKVAFSLLKPLEFLTLLKGNFSYCVLAIIK